VINKCPGQDLKNIQVETIACPLCGYKVEMFSDEIKVSCPQCKGLVCKERLPSCIDWCAAAKDCIGEEKWKELNSRQRLCQK